MYILYNTQGTLTTYTNTMRPSVCKYNQTWHNAPCTACTKPKQYNVPLLYANTQCDTMYPVLFAQNAKDTMYPYCMQTHNNVTQCTLTHAHKHTCIQTSTKYCTKPKYEVNCTHKICIKWYTSINNCTISTFDN